MNPEREVFETETENTPVNWTRFVIGHCIMIKGERFYISEMKPETQEIILVSYGSKKGQEFRELKQISELERQLKNI